MEIYHAALCPEGEEADHLVTRILPSQDLFENRLSACEFVAFGFVVFLENVSNILCEFV